MLRRIPLLDLQKKSSGTLLSTFASDNSHTRHLSYSLVTSVYNLNYNLRGVGLMRDFGCFSGRHSKYCQIWLKNGI